MLAEKYYPNFNPNKREVAIHIELPLDELIQFKIKEHVLKADIVVGAVGIPKFVEAEWVKDGAVIIDAGYHPEQCGDVDLEPLMDKCFAYTPVPGGVGPMTINTLILQTVEACENS